ncbi:MAG: ABC transporter permease [Candidatus Cloacimonadaceae bacterium]
MAFIDGIKAALTSILSHKLRSLLTLTGIVIGVLAVVTMFSSVYAIKELIQRNMEGMGWNHSLVIAAKGSGPTSPHGSRRSKKPGRTAQSQRPINYSDYLALRDEIPHKSIYGMIENPSLYRLKDKDLQVRIRATSVDFFTSKNYDILEGRYFNQVEEENLLPVCVLGYWFAKEHFPSGSPLGTTITLGKQRFKVVGVLADDSVNKQEGFDFNSWERKNDLEAVYIPLKYGCTYLSPQGAVHMIAMQSHDEESFAPMKSAARQLLLSRHNMYPNFDFVDISAIMITVSDEIDTQMQKWNITLFAIASISLIVGGIGLFSTLLISIQERMTEIGVRKSVGATDTSIFLYFIYESVILALTGAFIGIAIAWLILTGIGAAIKMPLYLPLAGVSLGIFFSLLIGVISGLYPAIKAARVDPIKIIG